MLSDRKTKFNKRREENYIATIYVKVRHWLFWYGVYGFCNKSCNDEITLYSDPDQKDFLGYFELTTEPALKYLLDNELDQTDDQEYREEIEGFLNSQKDIQYSYIYPRNPNDIRDQVPHFAPINENGHKPVYINVWSKLSTSWDPDQIKLTVSKLAKDFLYIGIDNVEFLEVPTQEETKISFQNDFISK